MDNATIMIKFARKPYDLESMRAAVRCTSTERRASVVVEAREMTAEEYDHFTRNFMRNHPWLDGKGGSLGGRLQVIAVTAPERDTIYINPEGYSYARYVGLAA